MAAGIPAAVVGLVLAAAGAVVRQEGVAHHVLPHRARRFALRAAAGAVVRQEGAAHHVLPHRARRFALRAAAGAVVRQEGAAHHMRPHRARRFALRAAAVVRREVAAHHVPWPARRFALLSVEEQPVLREAVDALRQSVAPRPSVVRHFPRERGEVLRPSPDSRPRASVRQRAESTRARRSVCDRQGARRLQASVPEAGPGSVAEWQAESPILAWPPERGGV